MRASLPNAGADKILQSNPPGPRQMIAWLRYPLAFHLRGEHVRSWGQLQRNSRDWKAQRVPPRQRTPIEIETTMGLRKQSRPLQRHECFSELLDRASRARPCDMQRPPSHRPLLHVMRWANDRRRGRFWVAESCGRQLRPIIPGQAPRRCDFWERYPRAILLPSLQLPLPFLRLPPLVSGFAMRTRSPPVHESGGTRIVQHSGWQPESSRIQPDFESLDRAVANRQRRQNLPWVTAELPHLALLAS